jgi:hypothetical protein
MLKLISPIWAALNAGGAISLLVLVRVATVLKWRQPSCWQSNYPPISRFFTGAHFQAEASIPISRNVIADTIGSVRKSLLAMKPNLNFKVAVRREVVRLNLSRC